MQTLLLLLLLLPAAPAAFPHSRPLSAQTDDLAAFDHELDKARPGAWQLDSSPSYARLRDQFPEIFLAAPGRSVNGSHLAKGTFALTFDDGPGANTQRVLKLLREFDVKATFFWLAKNVIHLPAVVHATREQGHSLQNHSYSHRNLSRASGPVVGREIVLANQVLTQRYAARPKYFRSPYGAGTGNPQVVNALGREELTQVLWNIDSLDWKDPNPARVAKRVWRQMELAGSGIILFHDIHGHTPEAVRIVLTQARSHRGIRFVTVDQALAAR